MRGRLVDRVGEDVEAGRGRAVEGGLERVGLLPAAVGLNDQEIHRVEPRGLASLGRPSQAASSESKNRMGTGWPSADPPRMDLPEPVRIGRRIRQPDDAEAGPTSHAGSSRSRRGGASASSAS